MLTDRWFTQGILSEVDDLFRRLDRGLDGRHGLALAAARPGVTVTEADGAYVLTADVPGLSADTLEVSFEGDTLTLKGRVDDAVEEGWRTVRAERHATATFERAFRFGRAVDADAIDARLADGVLKVTVPLRAPSVRAIPVQAS